MYVLPPATATDFYKVGHADQYPASTTMVYSNFTCRSDAHFTAMPGYDHRVVFFGLQGICRWLLGDLWQEGFFKRNRNAVVNAYRDRIERSIGPHAAPASAARIGALHDVGYLPILIKALPEGSRVNIGVPLLTIRNTDPEFYWLTNFLETQLSAELWKPIRNATLAYWLRQMLADHALATGTDPGFVQFQGHDFSFRGMSGIHDAAHSGCGHLLSFLGSDTISAIDYAEHFYPGENNGPIGTSVTATEHSVMCLGGQQDELGLFRRLITELYPTGIISIVSDTWDFWRVITEYAKTLKPEILVRGAGVPGLHKVVFRPDSGDPVKIICGDPDADRGTPAYFGAVECLWHIFGGTITRTNHRLLDQHVGLIYGDSIDPVIAQKILWGLRSKGFASGNVVFGIGSWTYQYCTRDSLGCAIKTTYGEINGEPTAVWKDPATDTGKVKKSARGLLRVDEDDGRFYLRENQTWKQESGGALQPVFYDGRLLRMESFSTIRKRLHPGWEV